MWDDAFCEYHKIPKRKYYRLIGQEMDLAIITGVIEEVYVSDTGRFMKVKLHKPQRPDMLAKYEVKFLGADRVAEQNKHAQLGSLVTIHARLELEDFEWKGKNIGKMVVIGDFITPIGSNPLNPLTPAIDDMPAEGDVSDDVEDDIPF